MPAALSKTGTHIDASQPSRRSILAGGFAMAVAAAIPGRANAQATSSLSLKRGGSIHSMMNWAELESGSKDKFVWPPFSSAKYQINPRLLSAFQRAGLDFIRLTIDPGPFMAADGARRAELDAILISRCNLILAAGLNVVVDFHPISQVAAWTPDRIITDEKTAAAYVAMIGRTASALQALDPSRVALEFMNEPPHGYDTPTAQRWQRMLMNMHKGARSANSALPLVISGAAGGGAWGLFNVDARAFNDDNIFWTFHYYAPHHFTHQGVVTSQSNMLHFRYLTDLPYPVEAGSPEIVEETVRQALMADKSLGRVERSKLEGAAVEAVRTYFASNFGVRDIAAEFDKVVEWARKSGVKSERILLGEFGAARRSTQGNGALNRHREHWMQDVRTQAEQRGFAWALWDIDDNQMGLVTRKGSGMLDSPTLKALGLNDVAG